jgi:hypothetical protein
MSYNRFQWWRSLPRHKKKDHRSHPTAKIENGDFEYPWDVLKDLEHAQADLRRLEEELENRMSKSSKTDIEHEKEQRFRLKRVKVLKLKEELIEEDIKRIEDFRETLHKTFYPRMNKEVKDLILNEIYEKKILEEKSLRRSNVKDTMKDSIQNTMDVYKEYEYRIVEYVRKKREENYTDESTVEQTV